MRLRTKLVLTASGLTFAIVLVLAIVFLAELLQQRVDTTAQDNEVLAQQVLLATGQAVENGMRSQPPVQVKPGQTPDEALRDAVVDVLRSSADLMSTMDGIVRYSKTVQDVSVTDASGFTILSTDPDAVNQRAPYRDSFASVRQANAWEQIRQVFGKPHVIDISKSLERPNHRTFLVVHVGIRSTFLRNAYEPWLRDALKVALLAILASVLAAALLSTVALRPLESIGQQLEQLTLAHGQTVDAEVPEESDKLLEASKDVDAVGRVSLTIDRLGREMRSREAGYTALQTNLNQMLDTLRDGVMLVAPDRRAVMISDAVAHFLETPGMDGAPAVDEMIGMKLEEIFSMKTKLGAAVLTAFDRGAQISAETVTLEDGRQVQISLDRIGDARSNGRGPGERQEFGTLLTLRDTGTALELEQELEVSRRLAAIGSLTANVGHEVKNPINAMVVHLELLRSKLAAGQLEREGAQKHVDILADEMHRLDRVVQTLADFSRPMELALREHDLRRVVEQTIELAGAEFTAHGVEIQKDIAAGAVMVRVDAELLRQALLNLLLNALQAMPEGGVVRASVRRDQRIAVVEIADNGVGIPTNLLPRIFDLYFTTKPKGSGIGLAMTYRIVKLHGGTMDVRSEADPNSPKRGTTFTLRIPVSLAVTERTKPGHSQPALVSGSGANNMESREIT